MAISFRPATRENVGLLIGLAGPSGGGKTMSAMRLAQGIVGRTGKFAMLDTESRRALHYAPRPGEEPDFVKTFRFDHAEIVAPFRPAAYLDAIKAAEAAGYAAIVVDSFSHEHAGEGGILDWHEEELERMAGKDWQKRERMKMAAWIAPKMAHKAMVQKLLQVRAHLILAFRAEEKVDIVREGGQTKIVPKETLSGFKGWIPICDKNLPFELTCSFILTPDKPGIPQPIKLQEQHKALFPITEPIGEASGQRLAEWARGGAAPTSSVATTGQPADQAPNGSPEDARKRPALVADIRRLGGKLKLSEDERRNLAREHVGADLNVAPVDKLAKLVNVLRERASEKPWGEEQPQQTELAS